MSMAHLPLEDLLPQAVDDLRALPCPTPFDQRLQDFTAELSRVLTSDRAFRRVPELIALGFWLRPANIHNLIDSFGTRNSRWVRQPRGTVFHVAPANVDSIFVYSWLISLLCGNRNLIRLSNRRGEQSQALLDVLGRILGDTRWEIVRQSTRIVSYAHDDAITQALSAQCDVRVVWGGDATIAAVRRVALPAHATEVCFPSRHSLAVLDAGAWLEADALARDKAARGFFNDAYWFSQFACSSPRSVAWIGTARLIAAARADFWPRIAAEIQREGRDIGMRDAVEKLLAVDRYAIDYAAHLIPAENNLLTRVWMDAPRTGEELHSGAGLFVECGCAQLADIHPLVDEKLQTVTYFGVAREALVAWLKQTSLPGIQRIVPFGQALDFDATWDGIHLPDAFTRLVSVR